MNVVRLNMSHGDHKSHKAVVDLVREYNRLDRGNLAIMLDTKGPEVRSGDIAEPIDMKAGKHFLPCHWRCSSPNTQWPAAAKDTSGLPTDTVLLCKESRQLVHFLFVRGQRCPC